MALRRRFRSADPSLGGIEAASQNSHRAKRLARATRTSSGGDWSEASSWVAKSLELVLAVLP